MCLESCGAREVPVVVVVEEEGLARAEVVLVVVVEGLNSNRRYLRDSGWSYHSSDCMYVSMYK